MRNQIMILVLLFCCSTAQSQITINLRKTFIDSFKNRVTIDTRAFEIYEAHTKPNSPSKDADLHFAGYNKAIGMPVVAEIMNARGVQDAVDVVHEFEGNGRPQQTVKLSGVWRIWCEHPNEVEEFRQGMAIKIKNTNPAHVFEIHPVTKINDINTVSSLQKIDGFKYKDAEAAFTAYSNVRCRIVPKTKTIIIETNGVGYNYVDFWIRVNEDAKIEVSDGMFVYATVLGSDFDPEENEEEFLISHKMRIAFVKDSEAYNRVKDMNEGDVLHIVGIPRVNLNLISWRARNAGQRPEVLNWNLPVEMVAVGLLEE